MSAAENFIDTSVLAYLLGSDAARANQAEKLLAARGRVSVQVLNELATVATRKAGLAFAEMRDLLRTIRAFCEVDALTLEVHDVGLDVHRRYGFSLHDSMIVASALCSGARTLYTEDLQHGQIVDGRLRIVNPFRRR